MEMTGVHRCARDDRIGFDLDGITSSTPRQSGRHMR
jgi:hypothetical protein